MATADCIGAPARVERWRPIPGWPGYRVSDLGRVQSRRHRNGLPAQEWRDLSPGHDGRGYLQVRLYAAGRRPRWVFVHQLVLLAFRGPPAAGLVARHVQTNDPTDCRLENLCYGTNAENMADKWAHGTAQTKEKRLHYMGRPQAEELHRRHLAGETIRALSNDCGRSYNAVQQAIKRVRARNPAGNGGGVPVDLPAGLGV